jgi:hypothetical protein
MKDIYQNIPMLNMNNPDFVEQLKDAVGLKDGEVLEITTPQFARTDGITPSIPDIAFDKLHTLSKEALKSRGCQMWDEPDAEGNVLWLYPATWYDHIPEGTEMVCIDGEKSAFKRGVTDDDMRYGALAYGFIRNTSQDKTVQNP